MDGGGVRGARVAAPAGSRLTLQWARIIKDTLGRMVLRLIVIKGVDLECIL